uniref:Uncharacterized protein n=1 Tax=Sphaerodactylus townsendi TaxID=933632 RepID=A0ACB8FUR0_9SAUR
MTGIAAASFFSNTCRFGGCGLHFPTLADLIEHIEDNHIGRQARGWVCWVCEGGGRQRRPRSAAASHMQASNVGCGRERRLSLHGQPKSTRTLRRRRRTGPARRLPAAASAPAVAVRAAGRDRHQRRHGGHSASSCSRRLQRLLRPVSAVARGGGENGALPGLALPAGRPQLASRRRPQAGRTHWACRAPAAGVEQEGQELPGEEGSARRAGAVQRAKSPLRGVGWAPRTWRRSPALLALRICKPAGPLNREDACHSLGTRWSPVAHRFPALRRMQYEASDPYQQVLNGDAGEAQLMMPSQ